ncbi:Petal death protein [Bienertia sinuspersici]
MGSLEAVGRTTVHRLIAEEGSVLMPGIQDSFSAAICAKTGFKACFDQVWPKKCGHMRGKMVVPAEEHAVKIAAAREAIGDSDFFLVARTDARAPHGLQEAIRRANLYREAGADATFVEAPANMEELKEVVRDVKGLRIANMIEGGKTPLHTPAEFKEMGFHLIAHSLSTIYATTKALIDIMKVLKDKGTTRDDFDKMVTFSEFNEMISLESWYELENKFKNFTPKSLDS